MDLVDEEYRSSVNGEHTACLSFVDDITDILDAAAYRRQGEEFTLECIRHDLGDGSLADTRRTPEDKGLDIAALKHFPQHRIFADKMLLTDVIVKRPRTHAFGQRNVSRGGNAVFPISLI